MATNFDYEIFEMFKDQCYSQLPAMESKILSLEDPEVYKENINDLFRIFHNYKSTSKYLGLDNIYKVVKKTEDVLGGLRNLSQLNDEGLIQWLLKIKDQFEVWMDEMELGLNTFSAYDPLVLNSIATTPDIPKPSEIIKTLDILYIDQEDQRSKIIAQALNKILNHVKEGTDLSVIDSYKNDEKPHIILLNMKEKNQDFHQTLAKRFPEAAIIVAFDKVSKNLLLDLGSKGINNILSNPIKGSDLKRQLLSIAHVYYSSRRVLINNKKIFKFIQTLEPLPKTIIKIQEVCDNDELSIHDLVDVINTDPIIIGIILNAANSPIYGLKKKNNSLENVVAVFGKKTIKAICFGMMSSYLGEMKLAAYKINEEEFTKIGSLRLALMNNWYVHVDKNLLSTLSTTAILGNLGQLLISKEIEALDLIEEFNELSYHKSFVEIEEMLLHSNTTYVTSDILNFWSLKPDIIDSIRYSSDIINAPLEIRTLAIANYVVYNLVHLDARIEDEIPGEILYLLSEEGLDPKPLENALKIIQSL